MNKEQEIKVLAKSFDYVEQIILSSYREDNELLTKSNIINELAKLLKEADDEIDRLALKDAEKKLNSLSFDEIAEIYDTLN